MNNIGSKRNKHGLAKYAKRIKKLEADIELANGRIHELEARPPVTIVVPALTAAPALPAVPVNPFPQPYIGDWPVSPITTTTIGTPSGSSLTINGKPVELIGSQNANS